MSLASPCPQLIVDHDALRHNYRTLRELSAAKCGAAVKANAYGLGVREVARTLSDAGCDAFFVATLEEGIELRGAMTAVRIFVLEGFLPDHTDDYLKHDLCPVLNTVEQLKAWTGLGTAPQTALHIDTGMNRLGVSTSEFDVLIEQNGQEVLRSIDLIMSHFACADEADHPLNAQQLERFKSVVSKVEPMKTSLANSAGIFLGHDYCGGLTRPGIALLGGNPRSIPTPEIKPVARLTAPILQIREIGAGDSIGYGARFTADGRMRLATLGIGYADGVPRNLSKDAFARIDGTPCPIVGRVSMDLIVIDVTKVSSDLLKTAQSAELIGETSLEMFADWCGTLNYEVLTSLGPRIERVHINRA